MKWNGYTGNIFTINLTSNSKSKTELDPKDIEQFVGGLGINTKLAANLIKPGIDSLSPENVIIIGTGPLVGTITPGASRLVGTTKFPATEAIAYSCGSMSFAFNFKHAGFDHLIITGKAKKPVYLLLENGTVEIFEAQKIWGKDIVESTDFLQNLY